jgi:anti-sigma regulatory factor (Ser/Thr protein kinase)
MVRGWLARLGFTSTSAEDLVRAVNEAATNAIEHAYPRTGADTDPATDTFDLELWTEDGVVVLVVTDRGRWRSPRLERPGRGLGIPMMQRLVDDLAIDTKPGGTRVLIRHPRPDPADPSMTPRTWRDSLRAPTPTPRRPPVTGPPPRPVAHGADADDDASARKRDRSAVVQRNRAARAAATQLAVRMSRAHKQAHETSHHAQMLTKLASALSAESAAVRNRVLGRNRIPSE